MRLADRYTSAAWMTREAEGLWPRAWLLAGVALDVSQPNQRMRFDIGGEPLIIARDGEGILRAFYNVCPHRGHQLCEQRLGRGGLRCPYHHWSFDLTGTLRARPDDDHFTTRPGLTSIRCEEAAGLVWVCMDPQTPPLSEWLGPVLPWLAAYRVETMSLTDEVTMPTAGNWKLTLDANNEHYHLHTIHPELLGMIDDTAVTTELIPPHGRMRVPVGVPSGRRGVHVPDPGRAAEQRARLTSQGIDVSSLSDAQLVENQMLYVFPNLQLNCYPDRLQIFRHRPHETDPARGYFDRLVLTATADDLPVRQTHHRTLDPDTGSLGAVIDADLVAVRSLQRGLSSRGFTGPHFGRSESLIAMMHATLTQWLSDPVG
ncbi:MAG: phenylpropionate dioxygenase-like ring-hydroxylating dioxygenase large terminal subunit [Myxococcota bacterium]|jgi:phenylpropionate dioxygenase-like ring-hydroxylating dioxygenase large terminal subunit